MHDVNRDLPDARSRVGSVEARMRRRTMMINSDFVFRVPPKVPVLDAPGDRRRRVVRSTQERPDQR
jgi:hypothetical protein